MGRSTKIRLDRSTAGVISTDEAGTIHNHVFGGEPASAASAASPPRDPLGGPALFISHAHEDEALAERLVAVLRHGVRGLGSQDIRCTSLGAHQMTPGVLVSSRLRAEVTGADVVLGLLTKRSLASPYVLFELGAAWGADVPVIAVRVGVGPAASLGPLDDYLSTDLVDDDDIERLLEGAASATGRSCEPARAHRMASRELLTLVHEVRSLSQRQRR